MRALRVGGAIAIVALIGAAIWFRARALPPTSARTEVDGGAPRARDETTPSTQGSPSRGAALAERKPSPDEIAELSGRVIDEHGNGVAGAAVTATEYFSPRTTTTNARGWFTFSVQPGTFVVEARQGGRVGTLEAPVVVSYEEVRTEPLVIRLGAGLVLAGTVRDHRGTPLADLALTIEQQPSSSEIWRTSRYDDPVRTDRQGRYQLEALLPGGYAVSAHAPGHGWSRIAVQLAASRHDVDLVLTKEAVVVGEVVGADDELAIASISAEVARDGQHYPVGGMSTAIGGAFELGGLPPGAITISARAKNSTATAEVTLQAGERKRVTLRLEAAAAVAGIVLDEARRPIEGAEVSTDRGATRRTGADGRFRFDHPGRAPITLTVRAEGHHEHLEFLDHHPDRDLANLEIVLPDPRRTLRGRVVMADGTPVWDAHVTVFVVESTEMLRTENTDPEGNFAITGVPTGRCSVMVGKPNLPTVHQPAACDDQKLVIKLPAPATIRGVVVDARGLPVVRYTLVHHHYGPEGDQLVAPPQAQSITSDAGSFRLVGVGPGVHVVRIETPDDRVGSSERIPIKGGEDRSTRIALEASATLKGVVIDYASRRPIAGALVYASHDTSTEADGTFALRGLQRGKLTLQVRKEGYVSDWRTLDLSNVAQTIDPIPLVRGSLPTSPEAFDGIAAENDEGRARVRSIQPGSPAMLAGLQAGDALLAINGHDVVHLGEHAIDLFLVGKIGAAITVAYTRGGDPTPRTAKFQLAPIHR